jgi:alanine racemase
VRQVKKIVGPEVRILAVLKADAYGHGAVTVARTAIHNGVSCCGVASVNEAVKLRDAGSTVPILVLGYTPAWLVRQALLHDVMLTLYDADIARALSRAATELRRTACVHLKVDTGMERLGLLPAQVVPFVAQVVPFVQEARRLPGLELEGIFTHFSVADDEDLEYTRRQLKRFREVLDRLDEIGVTFRSIHCANSAAILRLPESHFNMVRLGLAMYGVTIQAVTVGARWRLARTPFLGRRPLVGLRRPGLSDEHIWVVGEGRQPARSAQGGRFSIGVNSYCMASSPRHMSHSPWASARR